MDISSQEIEAIVKQVLAGMGGAQTSAAPAAYTAAPGGAAGDRGVFENVDDAVEAAWKAQRDWAANYKIEDRQRIIEAIRRCARAHVEEWCHKIVEETGMGRYEDKVEKHLAVINKTPGPECLTTEAKSGDAGPEGALSRGLGSARRKKDALHLRCAAASAHWKRRLRQRSS